MRIGILEKYNAKDCTEKLVFRKIVFGICPRKLIILFFLI